MRILDRYIIKSVFNTFLACIFVFLFLYVVIDVLSHLEDILKHQTNFYILIKYYLSNLPIMFVQVAPFACLLSTLYAFGKLNHDNEIIAMRSSGLSVYQITKTVILLGLMISLFVFWLNDRIVPKALSETQKMKAQMEEGAKKSKEKKPEVIYNLSMFGSKNRLFFINKFNVNTHLMEGITILEQDEHQNVTKKIAAVKGVYEDNLWKFYQSTTFSFDKNNQIIAEPQYFEEEIMPIPETPRDFINQRQRPDYMTIMQLDDYIWKLSKSGASSVIRSLKVDFYQRFTSPFTSLIIILLGIPFSLMMRKRQTGLSSIGVSILVGFLYYILDAISLAFGKGGVLPPMLAASLSHVAVFITSVYLIETLP